MSSPPSPPPPPAELYTTLPPRTIRLLTISPSNTPDTSLQCHIQETSLDTAPPYNALSYVWGSTDTLCPLTCNNDHLMHITPNLNLVLHEYLRRGITTPLWVDALCINQTNISERTSQVRLMQEIYRLATLVIVWLGPSHPTDELALETLKAINAPWATFHGLPLFTGDRDPAVHDAHLTATLPEICYYALATFLSRPWFTRIWIVQEYLSAREVSMWCGESTIEDDEGNVLGGAARMVLMHNVGLKTQLDIPGSQRLKISCAGRLETIRQVRKMGWGGMMYLLMMMRCFDAGDPRDKVFALVGLASDVDEGFVDYEMGFEEVVKELTRRVLDGRVEMMTGGRLDFWSFITREEDKEVGKASWAVDWMPLQESLYTSLAVDYPSEKPTIQKEPEMWFSKDEDSGDEILNVRGTIIDIIDQILPSPPCMRHLVPWTELMSPQTTIEYGTWHTSALAFASQLSPTTDSQPPIYSPTGQSLYEAFWRTLCCNRATLGSATAPANDTSYIAWKNLLRIQDSMITDESNFPAKVAHRKTWFYGLATFTISALTYGFRRHKILRCVIPLCLPWVIRWFNEGWELQLKQKKMEIRKEYMPYMLQYQIEQREFEGSFSQWCQGRQMCLTRQGYLGWAPVAARVGDWVGLFAGCRIPFVLGDYGGGNFRIVGDAYLHGAMNGEGDGLEGVMLKIT